MTIDSFQLCCNQQDLSLILGGRTYEQNINTESNLRHRRALFIRIRAEFRIHPTIRWSDKRRPLGRTAEASTNGQMQAQMLSQRAHANPLTRGRPPFRPQFLIIVACFVHSSAAWLLAQSEPANKQINVNWLYGSYVPKDVYLKPLTPHQRFKLYLRQTYTTPGIYIKTTLFALHDQVTDRQPEWGSSFAGLSKRLADRQAQFIIQNSMISIGDGLLGWEPRYDRCHCNGFWPRTKHAVIRNFATYQGNEKSLRPQVMPYLGAFASSEVADSGISGSRYSGIRRSRNQLD